MCAFHDDVHPVVNAVFHTYADHFVSVDSFSRIRYICHILRNSIYDWKAHCKLNSFVKYGSQVSYLRFINEENMSLLLAASGN